MTTPASAIHILRGPDVVEGTGQFEAKWCFNCRKRTEHEWTVAYDSQPSYYDPVAYWVCPRCHRSDTHFPGCG